MMLEQTFAVVIVQFTEETSMQLYIFFHTFLIICLITSQNHTCVLEKFSPDKCLAVPLTESCRRHLTILI